MMPAVIGEPGSPRISVITVTRNCAATIGDCFASLAVQSYRKREHVVVDGASTDGTLEFIEARRASIATLISEPDHGIYSALNKGLQRATGDVVGFLHGDDVFADAGVLARVASAFANPAVGAVYGDLDYVWRHRTDRVARHWRSRPFAPQLLGRGWMPPHPTLYVRREWYARIGGFDDRYRIAADYFSILQLFREAALQPLYVPGVMVRMRTGGASNRSFAALRLKAREDLDALRRSGVGGWRTLALKNLRKISQWL